MINKNDMADDLQIDGHVTVETFEKKLWKINENLDAREAKLNKRIDKYADKHDKLASTMTKIEISQATMLAYQKASSESSGVIIQLLTKNIGENKADIQKNCDKIDSNRSRINVFTGGVAVLSFLSGYLSQFLGPKTH